MRNGIIWVMLLGVGFCAACRKQTPGAQSPPALPTESAVKADSLLSFHFVGLNRLRSDNNTARLAAVEALPATRALEEEVLAKLARAPRDLLTGSVVFWADDFAPLIQPLLRDSFESESVGELRGVPGQTAEFVLAIRLNDERAWAWNTNLATVLGSWTGIKPAEVRAGKFSGWALKKHHPPDLIRFVRAGAWVVLGIGQGKVALLDEYLEQIEKRGQPDIPASGAWLEAEADWPKLSPGLSRKLLFKLPPNLPHARITLTGSGEEIRTRLDMVFSKLLDWQPEPWRIPTNIIRDPVMSFTAGQGIAPCLNRRQSFRDCAIEPVPNQFYLWALADFPFQTFLAVSSQDTTNLLARVAPKLQARFNPPLNRLALGGINWSSNNNSVVWSGLAFVVPNVTGVTEPNGEFLFAGLFPNTTETNPAPPELFGKVAGRTNLAYFDWEMTQFRLPQWRVLSQLALLLSGRAQLDGDSCAAKWLDALPPFLGKSVTEATVGGGDQLTITRTASLGLTGIELVALANWIESPRFPLCGYRLPAHNANSTAVAPAATTTNAETRPEH